MESGGVRERERKEELVDQLSSEPPRLNSPLLQSFFSFSKLRVRGVNRRKA